MQECVAIQVYGMRFWGGMERKCATTVEDSYCSAPVSTTSGSLTHGFHTRESTRTYTWECRDRGLRSIIDYFLIRMEARKQIVDVKVVRGAEIGSGYDLVLVKVKLKSQVKKKNSGRCVSLQIRIDKLKDVELRREYQAAVEQKCEEARQRGTHQERMLGRLGMN